MNSISKVVLLAACLALGQAATATPQDDVNLIMERSDSEDFISDIELRLKAQFAMAYFRPIESLGIGIEIANAAQFIDLIPDEDIAPYMDRFNALHVKLVFSFFTPETIAMIATILRADEDLTLNEIFTDEYRRTSIAALKRARITTQTSGSDYPSIISLEEMVERLNTLAIMSEDNFTESFGRQVGAGVAIIFTLKEYAAEIKLLEPDLNNPVTIAAIEADGVLNFANPIQRQTLLRQLSGPQTTDGIRFLRPPTDRIEQE